MDLFRKLDPDGRRAARAAIDRLLATGEATAFAHGGESGSQRMAHHVRVQGEGDVIGRSETLLVGERRLAGRDPLTGLKDGRAARAWLAEAIGDSHW